MRTPSIRANVTRTSSRTCAPVHVRDVQRRSAQRRALAALGIEPSDRVATLAWNTHRTSSLFPAFWDGRALHTINPRLSLADEYREPCRGQASA
jgi:fatty-acyl-CoA synthase